MLEKIKRRVLALGALRRCAVIILGFATVATLIFIFSNSMKPPAESVSDSNAVKDVIATIIPPESNLGKKILDNIRKIAHFTEYGLLGIEVFCIAALLADRRRARYLALGKSLIFALVTAFIDETIQIFSSRGPMIADVWIDVGGFFTYSMLTNIALEAFFLGRYCVNKVLASDKNRD